MGIQSLNEFDKIHNDILDLLLLNSDDAPCLGLSQFDKFQSFMKDFHRLIETLVIQQCIQSEKLNTTGITITRLEDEINNLKDETKDLKELLYETEFKKLTFAITTPLKNTLAQHFRSKDIRMDPLDEDLIDALLNDTRPSGISKAKFDNIRCIYEGIADNIGIEYQHVIEVIHCRQQRNAEQHELLNQYVRQCNKSEMKLEFSGLLEHLHLNGLYKYKKPKMKILRKIFDFYMAHNEYR
jgi:hypothetical protein